MNIAILDKWRKRHGVQRDVAVAEAAGSPDEDQEGVAALLSECEFLRTLAAQAGLRLDDTPASLEELDQIVPRWRGDEDAESWLGNDAGLYLGTVLVRTVPGSHWQVWPSGRPVVVLRSGRRIDVVERGHEWARHGSPELFQVYAEASEA